MSHTEQMREALEAYESAREQLFLHCLSNGVFNAWNQALDCTKLNDAHLLAKAALTAPAAEVPEQSTRLRGGVPEGWRIDREGDDVIVVQHQAIGLARATNPATSMMGQVLFALADDILQDRRSLTAAPQAPAADAGVVRWGPLTPARLSSEEFDGLYWLALKGGDVVVGEYEWRQGWSPDGFNTQGQGRVSAGDVTHIARFEKPSPPAMSAQAGKGGAA